ncbi:MAG TPA: endonuclease domain-containing protein [Longimicrobium sp.]|jgi:very-short-patch-repair endonuclease|uniref:endonuclease domain-containing protein n=1 Tax=Longimicrobium sp. TaxID=2029185 RepID=UPI002EDB0D0E
MRQRRDSSPEVRAQAKHLRNSATPAEQRLWRLLRGRAVNGLKFRRQHPLHGFVLDFYCADARLCVELDGGVHEGQRERDEQRTEVLRTHGIRVIRFPNEQVFHDLPGVLNQITRAVTDDALDS